MKIWIFLVLITVRFYKKKKHNLIIFIIAIIIFSRVILYMQYVQVHYDFVHAIIVCIYIYNTDRCLCVLLRFIRALNITSLRSRTHITEVAGPHFTYIIVNTFCTARRCCWPIDFKRPCKSTGRGQIGFNI